jgi:hypothetical protein
MFEEMHQKFAKEKHLVLRGFLSEEMCRILYKYCLIKAERTKFKIDHNIEKYDQEWDGEFTDPYVMNVYSSYADPLMESILDLSTFTLSNCVGKNLLPNYSYWRLYTEGSDLKQHLDRASCEISASLCLGYDLSNLETDYRWGFNFINVDGKPVSVFLEPGDLLIYKGCDLVHWREPFLGVNNAQAFIHYNDADGPFKTIYDSRPILGIPSIYSGAK